MNRNIFGNINKLISIFSFLAVFLVIDGNGQVNTPTASTTSAETKKLLPYEELLDKARNSIKTPPEFINNLAELLNKFPYSEMGTAYVYTISRAVKDTKDANEVRNLIFQFIKKTETVPDPLKSEVYKRSAEALFSKDLNEDAAQLIQVSIDLFDDNVYLEYKKKQHEDSLANYPNYDRTEFDAPRTMSSYKAWKADIYHLLGKIFEKQNKLEQAEKAYRDSLATNISKNAALSLATVFEKNGKNADALKYATIAALTGKLVPAEMDYFYSVYAKSHQEKMNGVEEYLDAEYKKTYKNPVIGKKYKKTAKRSNRTVLAEFLTGAGCFPCMPFDYSFENALRDYSRKELAVLVYHWHAPTMDPLGNNSSDSRAKYYGVRGAPSVFIDGKKFENEGDYNGGDGEQSEIQPIADDVYKTLNNNLEIPADAEIKLKAKQKDQKVVVTIEADKFRNVSEDVTLQVALVENETSYSGENGLRFHFMVVRALAGDNEKREFGFKIDPVKANKFDYVFDVDKIVAQNLLYYDSQTAERIKEFSDRTKSKPSDVTIAKFKFNYKKNQINPKHLSVIAYLQDNKTKKILQSSYVALSYK